MIDLEKLMTLPEPKFLKHLGLSLYQIILYEYWKSGIRPVSDQSILRRHDVEYIKINLNEKENNNGESI